MFSKAVVPLMEASPAGQRINFLVTLLATPLLVKLSLYYNGKDKTKIHGNYVFIQDEQLTIVVVPGIANCTETKYVRTFTGYAMQHGFKVAVLNHLGAKKKESLSTPRIFTYGN